MGRQKNRKHRRPGPPSTGNTGAGRSKTSGTNTGENAESTGASTGDKAAQPVAPVDRLTPENTVQEPNSAPAQLIHEADVAMLDAPVDPVLGGPAGPQPTGPSTDDIAKGYAQLGKAALGMVCEAVAPNWEINDSEQSKIADALGRACALWFPEEIPEKWVALIVVVGAIGEVASRRRDPATGRFKPRHKERVVAEQPKKEPAGDPHAPLA